MGNGPTTTYAGEGSAELAPWALGEKKMMRFMGMALTFATAGILVAGQAFAQVEVDTGGTKVKVGADGKVHVDTGGTKVDTSGGDVDVKAGKTKVKTKGGATSVHTGKKGHVAVKVGLDGNSEDLNVRDTVKCIDNQELTLENIVVDGRGPALQAEGNCVLVLKNSVLKSKDKALIIKDNAEVTLINCTVQGKRAAVLTENATLKVQRSVVHGKTSVDDAAEIEKDDKSVFKR